MGTRSLEPQGNPLINMVPAAGIWRFLWDYKGIITFLVVVSVMGVTIYFKDLKIATQDEKITGLNAAIEFRDVQIENCKNSFTSLAQNIEDNAKRTEELLDNFDKFADNVEKDFNSQERQIKNLRDIATPKTCQESIDLLRNNIGNVKWTTPEP